MEPERAHLTCQAQTQTLTTNPTLKTSTGRQALAWHCANLTHSTSLFQRGPSNTEEILGGITFSPNLRLFPERKHFFPLAAPLGEHMEHVRYKGECNMF